VNADPSRTAVFVLAVGLGALSGCGPESVGGGGDECGEGVLGLGTTPCKVPCASWTNQVRPEELGTARFALDPDWSASPPVAEVAVDQIFRVTIGRINTQPSGCNTFDGGISYRSSDPMVLSTGPPGAYVGAGPGTARVIVDLGAPAGRTEAVELTVCSEPDLSEIHCPTRVPLVIRVVE